MELKQILIVYLIFSVIVAILAAWEARKDSPQLMFIAGLLAAPLIAFIWVVLHIQETYDWWVLSNKPDTHTNGRHPFYLFQILIDEIIYDDFFQGGLCKLLSDLTCDDKITAHEHSWLMSYLAANVPLHRTFKIYDVKSAYWWEHSKKKPRLKYLRKHQNKFL